MSDGWTAEDGAGYIPTEEKRVASGSKYRCPQCGGGFDQLENVTKTEYEMGVGVVQYDSDGCPWCGREMRERRRNRRVKRKGISLQNSILGK